VMFILQILLYYYTHNSATDMSWSASSFDPLFSFLYDY
jgi:hypothetical protein